MALEQLTIKTAHEGLRKKEFSARELTKAYLERVQARDGQIDAFITATAETALTQADELDRKGDFSDPLCGIPVGIKDIFCTKGVRTTAGSKILENYVPPFSATVIEKLDEHQPVMLGKLNMDEFACGNSTETSYYKKTKNPWDLARIPGGSSGGSAAAVAADECIFALGTDTGGSIRQPAAMCGVVGLKPTYGRVSRYGVMAMASSLDQVGPITKTAEDAAIVLSAIAGRDKRDATTTQADVLNYAEEIKKDIHGLKIGVPKEYFVEGTEAGVEQAVREALTQLESMGAELVDISLPHSKYALATYYIIMPSELSANLARYDGVRFGYSADAPTLMENYLQSRGAGFGPEIKRRIMIGTYSLSSGYYDAYYAQAQKVRTVIKREFDEIFKTVDCIASPTAPTVAFKIGEKIDDPLSMYLADIFTVPVNIAGLPGISVSCGFSKPSNGDTPMPVGLQLIGRPFDEATILRIAHQYQTATDWHTQHPTL